MKILWFTLTPCGATEMLGLGTQGGGWLSSLEQHLVTFKGVELHICFQWDTDMAPFVLGGTTYHPVRRSRMKNKILSHLIARDTLEKTTQSYANVISDVNPDLIHVHGTEEDFGMIQAITDIPVIISIQGILNNYVSKYFSGISFVRLLLNESIISHLKLKSILSNYIIFKNNAKRERKMLLMAKHVIGRTSWDRRSTAVLAPSANYYYGDEILRSQFYEYTWNKCNYSSPLRLVTVLSIAPYKGFETILNVSRILNEQIDFDFIWTVVGLTANDAIVKICYKWLGEEQKVQLLGTCSASEVCKILLGSDIYCQVSHIENSPNSLCEAMLIGMPIVASYAGGTDSMLCGNVEGILVQDGDPWSMAGAILELSQNYELAARMGSAARDRALNRHSPERIVNELVTVYSEVSL